MASEHSDAASLSLMGTGGVVEAEMQCPSRPSSISPGPAKPGMQALLPSAGRKSFSLGK